MFLAISPGILIKDFQKFCLYVEKLNIEGGPS